MWRYLRKMADPDLRQGLLPTFPVLLDLLLHTRYRAATGEVVVWIGDNTSLTYEGDMNFTNRATGDMVTWKELCYIASSKGCTIGRLEVPNDGDRDTGT
jgi:hypothetical protein